MRATRAWILVLVLSMLACIGCGSSEKSPARPNGKEYTEKTTSNVEKKSIPTKAQLGTWKAKWTRGKSWELALELLKLYVGDELNPISKNLGKERYVGFEAELPLETSEFEALVGLRDDMSDHYGTIFITESMNEILHYDLNDQIFGEDASPVKVRLLRETK